MTLQADWERRRVWSWIEKGGTAIIDQALFAGTNFLINILLARWLEPVQYGAFAVAYSIFLVLSTVHTAVFTEPMLVLGAGKYSDRFHLYVLLLMRGHWWVSGAISLLLALSAATLWFLEAGDLAATFAGLIIVSPLILLMWFVRRAFYLLGKPHWSAAGGLLYLVLVLAGMYAVYAARWLTAASSLLPMGFACLIVSAWLIRMLHLHRRREMSDLGLGAVLLDHWNYGRWAAATATLNWLPATISYVLLPSWFGLEAGAALRAVMNLVMPILHAFTAVSVVLLPPFVRALKQPAAASFHRIVGLALATFVLAAVGYWGVCAYFQSEIFSLVYGGRYSDYAHAFLFAAFLPVPIAINSVLGSVLRAMERPDQVFWCQGTATVVAVTLGFWLMYSHGVIGAVLASLAASFAAAIVNLVILWRSSPQSWPAFHRTIAGLRAAINS
jgi:O-antigen/teichoic acid export membrane protein